MKCTSCGSSEIENRKRRVGGEIRNEVFQIDCDVSHCKSCGFEFETASQARGRKIDVADAYRTKLGLLTSGDIKSIRRSFSMSQVEFAKFLSVGQASIKRWESSGVQDVVHDVHIRVRSQLQAAKKNFMHLIAEPPQRRYNHVLPMQAIKIALSLSSHPQEIYVACFYLDVLVYKSLAYKITGWDYILTNDGPIPESHPFLLEYLESVDEVKQISRNRFVATSPHDVKNFTEKEAACVGALLARVERDGIHSLIDAFKSEDFLGRIPLFTKIHFEELEMLKLVS